MLVLSLDRPVGTEIKLCPVSWPTLRPSALFSDTRNQVPKKIHTYSFTLIQFI